MLFEISHVTDYVYGVAAAEAYIEARLQPLERPGQTILKRKLLIAPNAATSTYTDFFGNTVEFFSLPYRHRKLTITNQFTVRTKKQKLPDDALDVSVQEARQLLGSTLADIFDYLQPTETVKIGKEAVQWAKRCLPGKASLRTALETLNKAIFEGFEYRKGSTDNSTPLATIWREKKGVCQDFAHVMLSILRTAGLPSRYVCGYIDAYADVHDSRLVGAMATHAWVEVLLPGKTWVALDPTNDQWCGERHVAVSFGRDFRDAAPLRGTFKGSGGQSMKVRVFVKKLPAGKAPKDKISVSSATSATKEQVS